MLWSAAMTATFDIFSVIANLSHSWMTLKQGTAEQIQPNMCLAGLILIGCQIQATQAPVTHLRHTGVDF